MATPSLLAATKSCKIDEVKKLLQSGADVNEMDSEHQTALHCACQKGNLEIVKLLLAKKANINCKDVNGWTPLHCAASTGFFKICERLLQQKNIEITNNNDGASALFYVVRHSGQYDQLVYLHVLTLLQERGANLNARNNFGESPLHLACLRGNIDAVRFLLSQRVELTITNRTGETSLHYAIRAGKTEFVRLLLEAGSNPAAASERGTPLEVATKMNNKDIINLITEKLKNPHGSSDRFKEALKSGFLFVHVKKTRWQRYFFVVKDNICSYYKSDLESEPIGSFEMPQTSFKEMPDKWEKLGCFKLEANGKSLLLLSAGSDALRSSWFCALRAASVWKPVTESNHVSGSPTINILQPSKVEMDDERLKSELLNISQAFGNKICADCNQKDPLWVSLEVGAFVCAECASIHQQLKIGTIKCVNSPTEKWQADQIASLKALGNCRVNVTLEKNLPKENFEWPQPNDPWEKKEQFIKAKYITKSYKGNEEGRSLLPDEIAFQYRMSKYAAMEFKIDYDRVLVQLGSQLAISPSLFASIPQLEAYKQCVGLIGKYIANDPSLNEKTLLPAFEKIPRNKTLLSSAHMKLILDSAKFVKNATKTKTTKETLIKQIQNIVHQIESKIYSDIHTTAILQWWLPQLIEMFVMLDSATIASETIINTLIRHFIQNCNMALYLFSGDYLYDIKLFETLPSIPKKLDEAVKLFEAIKAKSKAHTDLLRKDVQSILKEPGLKARRRLSVGTNTNTTGGIDEEESYNPTTDASFVGHTGLYKFPDIDPPEQESEQPLLKMWQKTPLLHSLFNFLREIPNDLLKKYLKLERYSNNSVFSPVKEVKQNNSSSSLLPLGNILLNKQFKNHFAERLTSLKEFLESLQNTWPESESNDGQLNEESKNYATRQVLIMRQMIKDLNGLTPPFNTPEVLFHWQSLLSIILQTLEFLLLSASIGLARPAVRQAIVLISTQLNWSFSQFSQLAADNDNILYLY